MSGSRSARSGAFDVVRTLAPVMTAVSMGFLVIGLALPVLPLHVHRGLGLGAFAVGIVSGAQFASSLVSRIFAGRYADRHGGKRAVALGLLASAGAGLLYLLSLSMLAVPMCSFATLLAGRALLGTGESFIITGALGWGFALVGRTDTGKVISWVGTGMYAALALGAPVGTALYSGSGFVAIAVATTAVPLATLPLVLWQPTVQPGSQDRNSLPRVVRAIWVPGLGLALCSVGFGAMTAFSTLLFVERGWEPVWAGFSVFAVAFILARVVLGHLPDKLGGARVALASVLVEALGLATLSLSPAMSYAVVGATLAGVGYSLAFPGFGVEAITRTPPQSRGLAMGAFTAFLDLSLGLLSPVLGLIGGVAGMRAIFLASAIVVLLSAGAAVALMKGSN